MWDFITQQLSFTGVEDKSVWQDILITVLLIPVVLTLLNKFFVWWNSVRPSRMVLRSCLDEHEEIIVFHSQMSGADADGNFNPDQKYITRYPNPLPSNHANLGEQKKHNVDPVVSEAEMQCLAEVYNVLGKVGKVEGIRHGDLINDWNAWSNPIFSIGFNPKTCKLIEKCRPISFGLEEDGGGLKLKIKKHNVEYNSRVPNDAGVVQKTFIKDTDNPVYILAGLGTTGTSAAGYIFRQNFIEIGKLFGSRAFCIFLKVKLGEGKESALIDKIYPKPRWYMAIFHPVLYYKFRRKEYFEFGGP